MKRQKMVCDRAEHNAAFSPPRSFLEAHCPHFPPHFAYFNPTSLPPFFTLSLSLPLSRKPEAMKIISIRAAFFGSFKKKSRSVSRSEASSFGSNATSFSSSEDSQFTPKTVLPPSPSSHLTVTAVQSASIGGGGGGGDESWSFSSTDYSSAERERGREGRITRRELEVVLRRLGPDPPTEEEILAMLAEADRAGDGSIPLQEIAALGSAFGPPVVPELQETFAVFDTDGDGKISAEELLTMFVTLGDERCTLEDCRRMIGVVDSDGDGFVCFQDFVRMMAPARDRLSH